MELEQKNVMSFFQYIIATFLFSLYNTRININIFSNLYKMQQQYYQGQNLQNYFYRNLMSIQYPYFNDYPFGYLFNRNSNYELFSYSPQISLQSPSSIVTSEIVGNFEKKEKKEQHIEKSLENEKKIRKMQYLGRNDFSNMFKSFLFLVFKCQKTKTYIKNMIKSKNLPISLNTFSNKLKRKFPDSKTYIGPKEIRKFFLKLEKNEFAGQNCIGLLLKILLRGFLQNEYKLYVIKKYKGKNQSKRQIFGKCRILYKQVFCQQQGIK